MSLRGPSLQSADALQPPPYQTDNLTSGNFSQHKQQEDKNQKEHTSHDSAAFENEIPTTYAPSSSPPPPPSPPSSSSSQPTSSSGKGLFSKLKSTKDALKQNLDEGIARGKSEEGVRLANRWNSQHIYASFGVPVASIEKWQEYEDKKQAKKDYDLVSKELGWDGSEGRGEGGGGRGKGNNGEFSSKLPE